MTTGRLATFEPATTPLEDLFVSIDLDEATAYVVYANDLGSLRWQEIPTAKAERLAAMGARAQITVDSLSLATKKEEDR